MLYAAVRGSGGRLVTTILRVPLRRHWNRDEGLFVSCLSARPPDLADAAITRPRVAGVLLSIVPFVYSKRAAAARSPRSRYRRLSVLWPLRPH